MVVRWGPTISTQFTVANGVKQGGIKSVMLMIYVLLACHPVECNNR